MYNDQIAARRADDQFTGIRTDATSHQTGGVKYFLICVPLFGTGINVPRKNTPIKAGRDEQIVLPRIFDIFHPIQMAVQ